MQKIKFRLRSFLLIPILVAIVLSLWPLIHSYTRTTPTLEEKLNEWVESPNFYRPDRPPYVSNPRFPTHHPLLKLAFITKKGMRDPFYVLCTISYEGEIVALRNHRLGSLQSYYWGVPLSKESFQRVTESANEIKAKISDSIVDKNVTIDDKLFLGTFSNDSLDKLVFGSWEKHVYSKEKLPIPVQKILSYIKEHLR